MRMFRAVAVALALQFGIASSAFALPPSVSPPSRSSQASPPVPQASASVAGIMPLGVPGGAREDSAARAAELLALTTAKLAGPAAPQLSDSLAVATARYPLVRDFVFGTAATAAPGQTPISNTAQLSASFLPFEDFTGTTVINNELERFQPFSSAQNFVFTPTSLNLNATLDSGGNVNPIMNCQAPGGVVTGTPFTPPAGCPANTAGLQLGQMVVINYTGVYKIVGLTATQITLGSLFGSSSNINQYALMVFTPYTYATTSAAVASQANPCLTFNPLPAGVTVGQFMTFQNGGPLNNGTWRVTSVSATQACVDTTQSNNGNLPAVNSGQDVLFIAPIRSGQIWSKDYFAAGVGGVQAMCMELTATLPPDNGLGDFGGGLSAIPTGSAVGSWPAFWLTGGNSFPSPSRFRDASEWDVFEFQNSVNQNGKYWTGNNHGGINPVNGSIIWRDTSLPGAWDGSNAFRANSLNYTAGQHKFGFCSTPTQLWRYVDGQLYRTDLGAWGEANLGQIGIDLAVGSIDTIRSLFMPMVNASFPYVFSINELKVWVK